MSLLIFFSYIEILVLWNIICIFPDFWILLFSSIILIPAQSEIIDSYYQNKHFILQFKFYTTRFYMFISVQLSPLMLFRLLKFITRVKDKIVWRRVHLKMCVLLFLFISIYSIIYLSFLIYILLDILFFLYFLIHILLCIIFHFIFLFLDN